MLFFGCHENNFCEFAAHFISKFDRTYSNKIDAKSNGSLEAFDMEIREERPFFIRHFTSITRIVGLFTSAGKLISYFE